MSEVEKGPSFFDRIDPTNDQLKAYPMSMVQYIFTNLSQLAEVAGWRGGLEFARCLSFLAPEDPMSVAKAPGPGK